ncbi:unnamed protein product [Paramecium octaurelia]|uniref:Uncharacterized protein n=1 Tax=Paramecium octaurelia TaxID=43137 RepID=A0A8S1TDK8_PAROT|nr:unnamed protein product [Paramecium octaurelia]
MNNEIQQEECFKSTVDQFQEVDPGYEVQSPQIHEHQYYSRSQSNKKNKITQINDSDDENIGDQMSEMHLNPTPNIFKQIQKKPKPKKDGHPKKQSVNSQYAEENDYNQPSQFVIGEIVCGRTD